MMLEQNHDLPANSSRQRTKGESPEGKERMVQELQKIKINLVFLDHTI